MLRNALRLLQVQPCDQDARTRLVYGQADVQLYDLIVSAEPGDRMILWYELSGEPSDTVIFQIEPSVPALDAGGD